MLLVNYMITTPKVLVITGPTATGKTALSVALAHDLGGEVISADSMQLYRRMDIGTAKVTAQEKQGIPHHMVDILEPEENYSVARYVKDADACVQAVLSRGALPIITGGTGLYIDSLVRGIDFDDDSGSQQLRCELSAQYDALGGQAMLSRLAQVDPQRAAKLHPSDKKRVLRALEVYTLTGKTITAHDEESRAIPPKYSAVTIALTFKDRDNLYARIDDRVDKMVEQGLFAEVSALLQGGVSAEATSLQAIGYKEAAMALRGEISQSEAIELIKRESRRYSKRQLTWLRRKNDVNWIYWDKKPDLDYARRLSTAFFDPAH